MPFLRRNRLVNPRLGTYFSIFTSLFVGAILLSLMAHELNLDRRIGNALIAGVPLLATLGLAVAARTTDLIDYFAAGRRVPAFFVGLTSAVGMLGATGLVTFPGALMIMGVDAFALVYGWIAGLILATVLIAPFLRKVGAFTLPSYFFDRFSSRTLRIAVAVVVVVPLLAIVAGEARLAARLTSALFGLSPVVTLAIVIAVPTAICALGGLRAVTWTSAAKSIVVVLAVLMVTTIAALMLSQLPLPQITHGSIVREISQKEALRVVQAATLGPLEIDWADLREEVLSRRYLQSATSIGWLAFPLTALMLAAGFAAMPHALPRFGATPAVYDVRKAHGWAVVIAATLLITLAAGIGLWRGVLLEQIVGQPIARAPSWTAALRELGVLTLRPTAAPLVELAQLGVVRDKALLGLAITSGLPMALVLLLGVAAAAAAMVAISAAVHTIATTLSEDVAFGLGRAMPTDPVRIWTARVAACAGGALAYVVAALPADPLQLVLAGVTLTASAIFPVLVLSIMWRRMTAWGALLGLLTGFGIALVALLVARAGFLALAPPLPAVVAMPAAVIASIVGSYMTRQGGRGDLELLRDMRVPGGETIRDRAARLARAKELIR